MAFTRAVLEETYKKYNRKKYIHPDPLEFVHKYRHDADREVAGLIAACLAYGRVQQILKSVGNVLEEIEAPHEFVLSCTETDARRLFKNFKHRFTTGEHLAALLFGAGETIRVHGSLGTAFKSHLQDSNSGRTNSGRGGPRPYNRNQNEMVSALCGFTEELRGYAEGSVGFLLPDVSKGSACKRLFLYLRWMVRKDAVDPGCWKGVPKQHLIIPLDTHMHRIGLEHGLTKRKQTGIQTAMEITEGFKKFSPKDPVKYDFALTRPGIGGY